LAPDVFFGKIKGAAQNPGRGGWVESNSGAFESGGELKDGLAEDFSKVILDADSTFYRDRMSSINQAHNL
jgi:hypothetical protein